MLQIEINLFCINYLAMDVLSEHIYHTVWEMK